jgi:hypothetical protein
MSVDTGLAAGPRTVDAPPELSGWAGAASAIHAIQQMNLPMTLLLDVSGFGGLTLDFGTHAFEWDASLADFPHAPTAVLVETRIPSADDPPAFELPGRPLDSLLWLIGYHAFPDAPAPWLRDDDRYRLRRWPALAELSLTLDQVRMTAMLGNAFATSDELAAAARTPPADARRLVNAFSTTGILRRSSGAPPLELPDPTPAAPASTRTGGLFSRLRERWGR